MASDHPLIGLFTVHADPLAVLPPLRLRALAAEAALQGARFCAFAAADIDIASHRVLAWVAGGQDWERRDVRLPDVVMNVAYPRTDPARAICRWLRDQAPFTTCRLANKAVVAAQLADSAIGGRIIPFAELLPLSMAEELAAFLAAYPQAVIKRADGRRGREVLFVDVGTDTIKLQEDDRIRSVSLVELLAELQRRYRQAPWIVQQYIPSRTEDGRPFDIRVHVHKDGDGVWQLVRSYLRLGEQGLRISNTSRGGYQGDVAAFARLRAGTRAVELVDHLTRLGLDIARTLDESARGALDELGIDLVLDPDNQPWLVEVNTHPQSRHHELDRARFAISYALYLAGQRRQGVVMPTLVAGLDHDAPQDNRRHQPQWSAIRSHHA